MLASTITHEQEFTYLERIYLHGTIEEEVGYDLLCCDDELLERINKFKEGEEETLVRFDRVKVKDKEPKMVVMYIWKGKETNFTLGLVVDNQDVESVQYATSKMKARVDCL